jgi:hypothetical protein
MGAFGRPSLGKSTISKALTHSRDAEVANYASCATKLKRPILLVLDFRFDKITELVCPSESVCPALLAAGGETLFMRREQGGSNRSRPLARSGFDPPRSRAKDLKTPPLPSLHTHALRTR